jgi:hypothetical protein
VTAFTKVYRFLAVVGSALCGATIAIGCTESTAPDAVADASDAGNVQHADVLSEDASRSHRAETCEEVSRIAQACGRSLDCSKFTMCSGGLLRPELAVEFFSCAGERICVTGNTDKCIQQIAEGEIAQPGTPSARYHEQCSARHQECAEAGAAFNDDYCGPPYGGEILFLMRTEPLEEIVRCLSKPCVDIQKCIDAVASPCY